MEFKRIKISFKGDDGEEKVVQGFENYKQVHQYVTQNAGRDFRIHQSRIVVEDKTDFESPDWANMIGYNSDGERYDVLVENGKLIKAKRVK
jgi:hypothetical protein